MAKKRKNQDLTYYIDKLYWFLKYKLKFDDFQAITFIVTLFVLPVSIFLGFQPNSPATFLYMFYFNIALIISCIIYTILKIRKRKHAVNAELQIPQVNVENIKFIDEVDMLSGLDFERFIEYIFQKKGYRTELTKQSHDKGADIIAEKGKECVIIQAKRHNKAINKQAIYEVYFARKTYQGTSACIATNNELTEQAVNVAHECGIQIIDRSKIRTFLRNKL